MWKHLGYGDHRSRRVRHGRRPRPRRRLVARRQLPVRRPDLPAGQPAAARAAVARPRQAPPARPLGHDARPEPHLRPSQPRDPRPRPRRHLHLRPRPRRSGHGGQHLPGGDLQRDLPRDQPGRDRPAGAVPPVLVPGRHPQPRRPRDARLDPRGRRAGLRPGPRLRRRVRQPRPRRGVRGRRRRGRDGPARRVLALEQVPQPGHRRGRPADPSPQRLQDRQPHRARPHPRRRAAVAARGVRPHGPRRGRRRSHPGPPGHGRHARSLPRRDRGRPARLAGGRRHRAAPVADDRAAHAQGLDRAQGGRRPAGRGHVPVAPGAAGQPGREARPPAHARGVDAQLPARGAVRRDRPAAGRCGGAVAVGPAAHGRQPPRQRRPAAPRSRPARLPPVRGRGPAPRLRVVRAGAGDGRVAARRGRPQPDDLPGHGPGRDPVEPAGRGARRHVPGVARPHRGGRRRPRAGRPGDGGPVRTPVPGLAGGLHAHRPPRPVQLLRGVRPHRRRDVQPARQVAPGHAGAPVAGADPVVQLLPVEPRVAPGPQRLHPPGPRVPRRGGQQEGGGRAGLPAARRQLPAVGGGPLPAQPRLRQRDRGRQEPAARLARHARRRRPLHGRRRRVGVGVVAEPGGRRRAGRRDGVLRRRAHAGDAGGGRHHAPPAART